jgi:acyl-CoA thioesterase FadM
MHLNNARYMMLADVGRIDIFIRSGFWALCSKHGWGPMLGGLQSAYVREIKLWKRFEIVSTIESWEDRQMIGRHRFVLEDGRTAAVIMTTAGVYDRRGKRFVPMQEIMDALAPDIVPRPLTEAERAFVASHTGVRELAKSAS